MSVSLAVKYRPTEFSSVSNQQSVIKILERQITLQQYTNCYLFSGPSGCGKTTLARIFAYKINEYRDINNNLCSSEPIEIDGASNNGVDNIRNIISSANERSLDGKYKVYIIDECHMITSAGWNAFLKCIEEPPHYTIFIFCTTDPQKIPATILNRVMRFNLTKIDTNLITERLKYICEQEHFTNYLDACDYIAKLANGGMRDAIAMLEKCSTYSTDLSIENVLQSTGLISYDKYFDITNSIIDGNESNLLNCLNTIINSGLDLKLFINNYFSFILDLNKYCLFNNLNITKIPNNYLEKVKYTVGIENNISYFNKLLQLILDCVNSLKLNEMVVETISTYLIKATRGNF